MAEMGPAAQSPSSTVRWNGLLTLASRVSGAIIQIITGIVFTPDDFGSYAIFGSVMALALCGRDGGVSAEILRARILPTNRGFADAFWISVAVSGVIALITSILAVPLSHLYGQSMLAPMLGILALSILVGSPIVVCDPALQVQRGLRPSIQISVVAQCAGLSLSVILLYLVREPIAIPVGYLLQTSIQALILARTLQLFNHLTFPVWPRVWSMGKRTFWLVPGALAASLVQIGDYLALGLVATSALLGIYYFAFSLPAQAGAISVAAGLTLLLHLPVTQTARRKTLLLRSVRRVVSLTGLLTYLLAANLVALEFLIWGGRWTAAVAPSQIFSILFPLRLTGTVGKMSLLSRGRYLELFRQTLLQGVGMFVVALFAGWYFKDVRQVALVNGIYLAVATLLGVWYALSAECIRLIEVMRTAISGLAGPALAGLVAVIPSLLGDPRPDGRLAAGMQVALSSALGASVWLWWSSRTDPGLVRSLLGRFARIQRKRKRL